MKKQRGWPQSLQHVLSLTKMPWLGRCTEGGSISSPAPSFSLAWFQVVVVDVTGSFVTHSQGKASPGSAVTWPLPCACHHLNAPSSLQLSTRHMSREILVGKTVQLERILFVLSICVKLSVQILFFGVFFPCLFVFSSSPSLSLWIFTGAILFLTETSTPPPGKLKELCSSSLLLAGPTFDGLTPSHLFREWLEYTFSWSSGRYFFGCPDFGGGGEGRGWWVRKQNKNRPEI